MSGSASTHIDLPGVWDHRNAIKNKKFRDELVSIIREAGAEDGCSEGQGVLLYTLTSKVSQGRSGCSLSVSCREGGDVFCPYNEAR